MAENYGGDYLYTVLSNDATVSALVGTNIFVSRMVPDTISGNTINMYFTNRNAAIEYFQAEWSVDCRSAVNKTANDIAFAVVDAINRVDSSVNGYTYFGTCEVLGAVPPVNETDVYNVPVQIRLRRR